MRRAGERLGPYEILQLLGKGGMGEVYRARDTRLGREVALKTLSPERERDPTALARLRSEAAAVAALNHPHIVSVLDVGEEGPVFFLVMELAEGRTLRALLEQGPLPLRRALEIGEQMAEALAAAHARGIVHRDLKPENVMVTRDWQAKILDFGLAKLHRPLLAGSHDSTVGGLQHPYTEPGLVVGTAAYMSPEQVRGAPVDHRSDQFAFGVILHEMISGRRAFARPTPAETMAAILREQPDPAGVAESAAATPLKWVLERCLAKEPDDRYDSTRDLALELARIRPTLGGLESAGSATRAPGAWWRHRFWIPLAVAAGIILAAAIFWERRPGPPVFRQITFGRGTVWAGRYMADGAAVVYSAAWNGGAFRIYRKDPRARESALLPIPPPVSLLAISRASEMALATEVRTVMPGRLSGTLSLSETTGGGVRALVENVRGADYGPRGELAVVRCSGGRCALEYPLGRQLYETAGWITGPRVSPDGKRVAFIEHPVPLDDLGTIVVVDAAGKARALGGVWTSTSGVSWGPDGSEIWIAGCRSEGLRALYAVRPSGETRLLARVAGALSLMDVSPSGEALVSLDARRIGLVASARESLSERELTIFDSSILADLSDDGATILSTEIGQGGGQSYSVYLRRDDSPAVRLGDGLALALSPDGRNALALLPGVRPELVVYPTGTGPTLKIALGQSGVCRGASFFPDGKRIVAAVNEGGHCARLFVASFPGGALRPLGPECVFVAHLQGFPISGDGALIAAVGTDDRLEILSVADGKAQRFPDLPSGLVPVRWLADGHSLLVYRLDEVPARILRLALPGGQLTPYRELRLSDLDGVQGFPVVRFTPDGRHYAFSYARFLSDLYTVRGIE
jgi:hypothetical protein